MWSCAVTTALHRTPSPWIGTSSSLGDSQPSWWDVTLLAPGARFPQHHFASPPSWMLEVGPPCSALQGHSQLTPRSTSALCGAPPCCSWLGALHRNCQARLATGQEKGEGLFPAFLTQEKAHALLLDSSLRCMISEAGGDLQRPPGVHPEFEARSACPNQPRQIHKTTANSGTAWM